MEPINNEKFGAFINERRRALGLTQKELGERLFVSDKTVSKWERGASLPNIALLQPLADTLEVSVSELLNGERIAPPLAAEQADDIVASALALSLQDLASRQRRRWLILFLAACVVVIAEAVLLKVLAFSQATESLLMSGLFLLFAAWSCFFANPLLPSYYDENKIHFVQQGPFRLNMIGLRFNNSNWPPILTWLRSVTLCLAVIYPLIPLSAEHFHFPTQPLIIVLLLLLFAPIYAIGKKYE